MGKIEAKIGCKYCADDVISAILFCQNAFSPQCNWKDIVKKYDEKTTVALLLQTCRCRCCCPSTKLHFAPLKLTYCIFNKSEILSSDMTLQLLLVIMALELSDQNSYLILFYFSDFKEKSMYMYNLTIPISFLTASTFAFLHYKWKPYPDLTSNQSTSTLIKRLNCLYFYK